MHEKLLSRLVCGAVSIAVFVLPLVASAHEQDTFMIGGKAYQIKIGSLGEPLVVDNMSGVDLTVTQNGKGVVGVEKDLKLEIGAGASKKIMDLEPSDTEGAYTAPFIPTVPTTFSYRLFGTLNHVPVSLTFTCQPDGSFDEMAETDTVTNIADNVVLQKKIGGFGCPEARADYGFPEPAIAANDLSGKIEAAAKMPMAAAPATSKADIALVVGIIGLFTGAAALAKRRKG